MEEVLPISTMSQKLGPALVSHGYKDHQLKFIKKLREAMIELTSSELKRPLSPQEITHIEFCLRKIFHVLHSPDHPPYSHMIYRAIEELDEKGGSSRDCISDYIKSHYHDLPLAHKIILSFHLATLKNRGEILTTPPSVSYSLCRKTKPLYLLSKYPRSSITTTDPVIDPLAIVIKINEETKKPSRKRERPPKLNQGSNKAVTLKLRQRQEIERKTEEVVVEKINAKQRGRGRLGNEKNPNVLDLLLQGSCFAMTMTDPDANFLAIVVKDDGETKKPARKRGRSPKLKPEDKKVVNFKLRQRKQKVE